MYGPQLVIHSTLEVKSLGYSFEGRVGGGRHLLGGTESPSKRIKHGVKNLLGVDGEVTISSEIAGYEVG